jgi:cell division protein FtsW
MNSHDTEKVNSRLEANADSRALILYYGLLFFTMLLSIIGVVMVFSSSAIETLTAGGNPYLELVRYSLYFVFGLGLMLAASKLPWIFYKNIANVFFVVALVLQCLVFVEPLSISYGGNTNWVNLGFITFQPSEILKLALILWLASMLYPLRDRMSDWKEVFWPSILGVAIAEILILAGRDLGTVLIITIIVAAVYLAAGIKFRWVLAGLGTGMGLLFLVFVLPNSNRMNRITQFFNACETDPQGIGYQMCHSMYSLGSGGLTGLGLGKSRQKWSYLPQASSDFILAVIGEELGLVGTSLVILLFLILGWLMFFSILHVQNHFQKVVIAGIMGSIMFQAVINIFVVIGLFPVVGLPLPFVSAGGSSLVISLVSVGVVMSFVTSFRRGRQRHIAVKPIVSIRSSQ